MSIHPELLALRSDPAPQRRAQAELNQAVRHWRDGARMQRVTDEITRFGQGEPLDALPVLADLFDPASHAAKVLVRMLIDPMVAAQHANPLGEVPLRHALDAQAATLILAQSSGSALVLQALDPHAIAAQRKAEKVIFAAGEMHERVLAGSGEASVIRLLNERPGRAELFRSVVHLMPDQIFHRDLGEETRLIERLDAPLVMLRLQRQAGAGALTREYALTDGRFLAQAAAAPRETRLELVAALLGRMGRRDAAPLLAAMAEEEAGQSLRWQALKECLALDTAAGFAALSGISARAQDPLAGPAGALRAQLIETYPQLGTLA